MSVSLSKIRALAVLMAAWALASGCGRSDKDSDEGGDVPSAPVPGGTPQPAPGPGAGGQPAVEPGDPETRLLEPAEIPLRVKGRSLRVRFGSNVADATFECLLGDHGNYGPCSEADGHLFDGLAHGQAYTLKVRAVQAGRMDRTPLAIAFVADRTGEAAAGVRVPESAGDLPGVSGSAVGITRSVQLGSFYGLDVPPDFFVTSYATTKTYNQTVHSMRIIGRPDLSTILPEEPCTREYERVVDGPGHARYCDATPSRSQMSGDYPGSLPFNHVESVRIGPSGAQEKIFVAAFDQTADPAEARLGIGGVCGQAAQRGEASVAAVPRFFQEEPVRTSLNWCQIRDLHGRWWWIGSAAVPLGAMPGSPRLRIIYAAAADLGLYGGQQFASLVESRMRTLLKPIAPVP